MRSFAHQRGAAAVFAAISLVAAIAAIALAIDLGRLYFVRRDLQRMANMAALDAVRVTGGCMGAVEDKEGVATSEASASLVRNGGPEVLSTVTAALQVGRKMTGGDYVRYFEATAADDSYAVRVSLTRPAPTRLVPLFSSSGSFNLRAVAAAESVPIATVSVGSCLSCINPSIQNPFLPPMLGDPGGSIDVGSYRGLFGASVKIEDLAAAAGAGSAEEFLRAYISAPELLNVIAETLTESSNAAVRATLEALAAGADAARQVVPGDVLGVPTGFEEPVGEALVNVGALVDALAQSANGDRLLDVLINAGIPGVSGPAQVEVRLIQAAQSATGPAGERNGQPITIAHNAQGYAQASLPLVPVSGTPLQPLVLYVEMARASAALSDIECQSRSITQDTVEVLAQSGVTRIGIGQFDNINSPNPVPQPITVATLTVPVPPLNTYTITIKASGVADVGSTSEETLTYTNPFESPDNTQTIGTTPANAVGSAMNSLAASMTLTVEGVPAGADGVVVTTAVQPVLDALRPALADVINQADDTLLMSVLAELGATVGGADVSVYDFEAAQPVLFAR